jgi:hypothetical protein
MRLSPELEAQVLRLAGVAPVPLADLTEEQFQAEVIRLAKRNGWRCYHTRDSRKSAAGFLDLAMVHRVFGFIIAELKVGTNQPSAAQAAWVEDLECAGVRVFVWRPTDWTSIEATLTGRT